MLSYLRKGKQKIILTTMTDSNKLSVNQSSLIEFSLIKFSQL